MSMSTIIFMKIVRNYVIGIVSAGLLLFGKTSVALAQRTIGQAEQNLDTSRTGTGIAKTTIEGVSASVIRSAFLLAGLFFFILVFYGGVTMFISRGSEEKVTKAKSTVTAAVIGLIIVLLAYAITAFVSRIL